MEQGRSKGCSSYCLHRPNRPEGSWGSQVVDAVVAPRCAVEDSGQVQGTRASGPVATQPLPDSRQSAPFFPHSESFTLLCATFAEQSNGAAGRSRRSLGGGARSKGASIDALAHLLVNTLGKDHLVGFAGGALSGFCKMRVDVQVVLRCPSRLGVKRRMI